MAGRGTNCTLRYSSGGRERGYRLRVDMLTFGFDQIAAESQARTHRAFYPHRTAPTQFFFRALFVGYAERARFNKWMRGYVSDVLSLRSQERVPQMHVQVPSRNFVRDGVPVAGMEYGDHIGSMVFNPIVIFQTSGEPRDLDEFWVSRVYQDLAFLRSPESEYFYPTGTQLSGDEAPPEPTHRKPRNKPERMTNGDIQDNVVRPGEVGRRR